MIDLHTHVLPGLDDGVRSLAEAVELVRMAAAEGTTVMAATPHVRDDYPTTPDQMETALADVRGAVRAAGLPVHLVSGGEVAMEMITAATELERYALGGDSRYVLVEFPYVGWPVDLHRALEGLARVGLRPVLAHPERNPDVQAAPARIAPLVEGGVLIQVTAGSLAGTLGRASQRAAEELIRSGLAHLLASDAHRPAAPAASLGCTVGLLPDALRRWLTESVPAAILAGDAGLPPRPPARSRRRWWR